MLFSWQALFFIIILLSSISITPLTFAQSGITLSPLKQIKSGIAVQDIKCEYSLQFIIKSEDSSPACVTPATFAKLISLNWGFDPSTGLTVDGLKDRYKVGEQIDFVMKFNELIGDCTQPHVLVKNQTNQTIWESKLVAVPCPPDLTLHHAQGEMKFGNSELGYLRINQTGSYYIHVWFGKEITEKIIVSYGPFPLILHN